MRYGIRSGPVLLRAIRDYSPLKFFGMFAIAAFIPGLLMLGIVTVHWLATGETAPYTQMITLGSAGILLAFVLVTLALIADLIARMRIQLDELVYESRREKCEQRHTADLYSLSGNRPKKASGTICSEDCAM
jgi:hypothetical protein